MPRSAAPRARHRARARSRFPSVTPDDGGALPYLRDLLAEAGFAAELVDVLEAPGTPTSSTSTRGIGTRAPNFVFAGHTDVVPPGDVARWRFAPFSAEVADGELWGRGACDMKGGVAAAVAAALRFVARGAFPGSISFLVTGDEEGPSVNGTVKLLDWALARGERFDHCIVGEPTSVSDARRHDQARTARLAERAADARTAARATSPIRRSPTIRSARSRRCSRRCSRRRSIAGNADFRPVEPRSRQRRRRQSGGQRHSRRGPPRLQRPLQRPLDAGDARSRDRAARRRRRPGRAHDARLRSDQRGRLPHRSAGRSPISSPRAVEDVTGRRPELSTSGGTSDARFIKDACPVVELGLVNATIHAVDERVALDDLEALSRIYERVLERYFASAFPDCRQRFISIGRGGAERADQRTAAFSARRLTRARLLPGDVQRLAPPDSRPASDRARRPGRPGRSGCGRRLRARP